MNEEKKTYGDQRYVEKWPAQFEDVHVTESIGANAALWNIEQYDVSLRGGAVYVNDTPLIFIIFQALRSSRRTNSICAGTITLMTRRQSI